MRMELKRIFYVTPTNYLELLKSYSVILGRTKKQIGGQRDKLSNGLSKLDEARVLVEDMNTMSEVKRVDVQKKTKGAEELVLEISKEQRNADERLKIIKQQQAVIERDSEETMRLAKEADEELAKALPALEAANSALEQLDKKEIAEIKAYASPPLIVGKVMEAVMVCLKEGITWAEAKKVLADPNFMKRLVNYDKENITPKMLSNMEKYTSQGDFDVDFVKSKSDAASKLCSWVRALESYAKSLKIVEPKREKKRYAEEKLAKMKAELAKLEEDFQRVQARLAALGNEFTSTNNEATNLKEELEQLQKKIDRGDKLVTGLASEKIRWEDALVEYKDQLTKAVGDAIMAAAFLSYMGPFVSEYRNETLKMWQKKIKELEIPCTRNFDFSEFLSNPSEVRDWQQLGLPTDKFSVENGVMVTKGQRWPLCIDPQSQASKWIMAMEKGHNIVKMDLNDTDPKKINEKHEKIKKCVTHGKPLLLCDVGEELDPVLDNVLNKSTIQVGGKTWVKFGEQEIVYHKNFKMFLTTRLPNPHYTPEVSTKIILVNFTVKQAGLEEQLLGIIVRAESPSTEEQKDKTVTKIAQNKKELLECEDKILSSLQNSGSDLLENDDLVMILQDSKEKSEEVKQILEQSESMMKRIEDAREHYRPSGK